MALGTPFAAKSWRHMGLESADRFVRDFHSIEDVTVGDPELINIGRHTFDAAAGETPMTVLKSLLLKQPDALILPDLFSPEVAKLICSEVANEGRYAITRIVAGSSIEAIIKLMATYSVGQVAGEAHLWLHQPAFVTTVVY
ncbi:MAG: hypothetical protein R3C56_12795 [Pirellulaceae bacterium]